MYYKKVACFVMVMSLLLKAYPQSYQKHGAGLEIPAEKIDIKLEFFGSGVVRVVKLPKGRVMTNESLSVTGKARETGFTVQEKKGTLIVRTKEIMLSVDLRSGNIGYSTLQGKQLLKEHAAGSEFTPFNDAGNQTYTVSQSFILEKEEAIYGLGQQQRGKMVQRNLRLNMIQGNTDDYVPFFQSVKGYGVFWDNYSPTVFSDSSDKTCFKSVVGEAIDYYFMYGHNADGVIACMRGLTGQVPMFPLWTFGYWQSKERYKSQEELVQVVKKYRDLKVPLDGIIQDWQYWGNNYLWNAMEFLNVEFGNPQKMVNDVHALNAHMIISIWNSFGPQTKQYRELDSMKALLNFITWPESGSEKWPPNRDYPSGVKVYDPFNPAARDLYWRYIKNGLYAPGIDGWWMDSSEPDHLQAKEADFDNKTFLGSFRKVRNAFPLMTVGGVYQHQRKESDATRVFILTRSAFAGQQRYGANTWSGDVNASWSALHNQISAGLNFSLTGIPYWNSDIGGFFLWNFRNPLQNADYRELYARWLQFGTFCPMMRSHGADAPREIYQFGKQGDKVYDVIEKYINLRYRLLPYIYSTSWNVTANQSSMMRALMMDFSHDKNVWDINGEYMFGKSILVSPVTTPMYTKPAVVGKDTVKVEDFSVVKFKETYLPAGTDWFDFWSGEKLPGGQSVKTAAPLDRMPLFIKAGAIIPVGPDVQFAEEKKWNELEIRVYPGVDGQFVLYEDENNNYNYEKGIYTTITFAWDDKKKTLTIGDRKGNFLGMLAGRTFRIAVVGPGQGFDQPLQPMTYKTISYDGSKSIIKF